MARKGRNVVILILTDMDDDDFDIIVDNIEFKDNILFVCDRPYSGPGRKPALNLIVDSLAKPSSLIQKIKNWGARHKKRFSAIIGLDEEYRYHISAEIARELGLRFYPHSTLHLGSNKYLQKLALSNACIGVPDFQLVGPDTLRFRIDYPNVLKLMTGVGSAHLHLNRNLKELKANLRLMDSELKKEASNPILKRYMAGEESIDPTSDFMLEGYLKGNEYSCDYIVEEDKSEAGGKGRPRKNGNAAGHGNVRARVLRVVRKLDEKGDFGYFAGFYLFNPDTDKGSEFRLGGKDGLEEFCTNIAQALNIRFGVCMLDFKFHNGKFYVIETTLRPGVATFVELMAKQYGYITLSQCIRQRLGLPTAKGLPGNGKGGLVAYLNAPEKGTITKIDLSYIANNMENLGILRLHKYCEEGESCINVAYVLATASGLKEAMQKFRLIRSKSVIKVCKSI